MRDALICGAVRTPVAKKKQEFSEVRADTLAAVTLNEILNRTGVDVNEIEDVVMGCVTATDEQGVNLSRNAVLAAGWPVTIPGTTVNRLCGSSLQAVNFASMAIKSGEMDLVVASGAENMSRVPMGSDAGSWNEKLMDRFDLVSQGISAEFIAEKWELSRDELDDFSLNSNAKALEATKSGAFKREIVPVPYTLNGEAATLDHDTGPRAPNKEKIAALVPAFKKDGVVHAGNSSQISDGASSVLIASAEKAKQLGLKPRARIVASAATGVDPVIMLTGPITATQLVLKKAGLKLEDIDVIEINEAFASVVLAFMRETGADEKKINIRGGAIALGHPLGCTGAKLTTTALHLLEDMNKRYALITLCIGLGQGIATIIERV
ncbi:MAG: thiolase family protein [Planctomycetes bacterium]|nr:thiolase family protein [Planctomycetota bacterium]